MLSKFKFLKGVEKFGAPEGFMSNAKMIGAQGATDAAIKQVELNEDALAKYNSRNGKLKVSMTKQVEEQLSEQSTKVPERGTWMKLMVC